MTVKSRVSNQESQIENLKSRIYVRLYRIGAWLEYRWEHNRLLNSRFGALETRWSGKIEEMTLGFCVKQVGLGLIAITTLLSLLLGNIFVLPAEAMAGLLQDRIEQFPDWRSPPNLAVARGELYYPDWLAGEWIVTSTLVDAAAPLAPKIFTTGFKSSEAQLNQPITFPVRFKPAETAVGPSWLNPFPVAQPVEGIIADRVYNSTSLTEALMGKNVLESIRLDARSPNRQMAQFRNGQQLTTEVSDRATESDTEGEFISSELYLQEFKGPTQIFFNRVENTVSYRLISIEPPQIEADQMIAIYLSPQDPDYFKAWQHPAALYRYRLSFEPIKADLGSES